ncbi:hypothetical protein JOE31_003290 [Arthrobacter sp. PvP023]|nr:hypothetical protein [Arthrobacter sp. PvP023]
MDGNQGSEAARTMAGRDGDNLRGVVAMCLHALQQIKVPEGGAEQIEFCRRLEELGAALAPVITRLEVAAVLSRAPIATTGVGTSPMAHEAGDRLLFALINVVAQRDT